MPTWTKTSHKWGEWFWDLCPGFPNKTPLSCGRQQRFMRFNVVSASEDASLHTLVARLETFLRWSKPTDPFPEIQFNCCCDPFKICDWAGKITVVWDRFCGSQDAYCVLTYSLHVIVMFFKVAHMCGKKSGQTCGKWPLKQLPCRMDDCPVYT